MQKKKEKLLFIKNLLEAGCMKTGNHIYTKPKILKNIYILVKKKTGQKT